jgi:acetylornithine/N-succinyldiaminopimelate aminotransferase
MTTKETIGLFEKYVIGNYTRIPVVLVRGEGSRVWDADGKRYLDLFPGWGVNGLGHCHPRVRDALRRQAGELFHVANNFYMEAQGELARVLGERSFGGKTFFCNSGAEANEAALKMARLYAGEGRHEVVTMRDSFHGRTFGAITATGQEKYQKGFGPLVPGFTYVPFNDLDAVRAAVSDRTCAVMLELVQGEGGVNVADADYVRGLDALRRERGIVLIFDEVQTGVGRTGEYFGYMQYGVEPDIMTLAKALGGGAAIGATVARPEVAAALVPGTHATTYGGNPLACAAALAVFEAIEEEGILENVRAQGAHLRARLEGMKGRFPFVGEVRGFGLMVGAELDRPGKDIVQRAMEKGLLMNCTHDTVLRFLPALTVTRDEIDEGMDILEESLADA